MDLGGPPVRYPARSATASDVFRTGDSTIESEPSSPRSQLPAYGDEWAPPQYQESTAEAEKKLKAAKAAKAKRRTLCIRLLTSIFITVIVSLIVAAVVVKISDKNVMREADEGNASSETASPTMFTVEDSAASSATEQMKMDNTTSRRGSMTEASVVTTTHSTATSLTRKRTPDGYVTVDCPCLKSKADATGVSQSGDSVTDSCKLQYGSLDEPDANKMMEASVYSVDECLVARASYKGLDDDVRYRCTVSCSNTMSLKAVATQAMYNNWG